MDHNNHHLNIYIYVCYYSVTQSSTRKFGLITAFAVRSALNWDSGQCSSLNQRIQGILFLRPQSCAFRIFFYGGSGRSLKIPMRQRTEKPIFQGTVKPVCRNVQRSPAMNVAHSEAMLRRLRRVLSEEQSLSSEGFMMFHEEICHWPWR